MMRLFYLLLTFMSFLAAKIVLGHFVDTYTAICLSLLWALAWVKIGLLKEKWND